MIMEENHFYMTTADTIYGMMRKSFIYVTKIRKKTFCYRFVNDWQFREKYNPETKSSKTIVKIMKVPISNFVGKLQDAEYFRKLHAEEMDLSELEIEGK